MSKDRKIEATDRDDLILRALKDLLAGQAEILAKQVSILGAIPLLSAFKKDRDLEQAFAAERSESLEKGREFWEKRNNSGTCKHESKPRK